MSGENKKLKAEPRLGDFGECLVEGSSEERARGRRIKRRAIAVSVTLQVAGLAALVMAPLLAKPAELVVRNTTPIPPYSRVATHSRTVRRSQSTGERHYMIVDSHVFPITDRFVQRAAQGPIEAPTISGAIAGPGPTDGLNIADTRPQPARPIEPSRKKPRIHEAQIDPALLIHRVEPVFPALARQIRRNGKVELHAIIATDGSIQALEVVSGDPLFVQSALDAVRQWRYKPTFLNGQPVEIDTYITVIYTLRQ